MPTDTQVNDLKINVLSEAQYEQIQSPSSTELYLVPETVDTTPTSGSTNPITSGGVYNALQNIPEQEQSDWNETDPTDPAYIKNKPQNIVTDAGYVHTDNNYTTTEKSKLAGIESGAEANVQSDWNQTNSSADDFIKNKPTIPAALEDLNDTDIYLPDDYDILVYSDVHKCWENQALNPVAFTGNYNQLNDKPNLSTVATSGDYDDLSNKPTIPTVQTHRTVNHEQITDSSLGDANLHDGFYFPNAVQDYDGNWYGAVVIGDQVWLGENLRTKHLPDGTEITSGNPSTTALHYKDYTSHSLPVEKRGLLYSYAVTASIAPQGWKFPSVSEFAAMAEYLDKQTRYSSAVAKAMAATSGWASSETTNAVGNDQTLNNASGFNMYPTGTVNASGSFVNEKVSTIWASTNKGVYIHGGSVAYYLASYGAGSWSLAIRLLSTMTPIQFRDWYVKTYGSLQHDVLPMEELSDVKYEWEAKYIPNALTDYDGNSYGAVILGDQVWMAENLRTTHYADGTAVTYKDMTSSQFTLRERGLFYNWPAVMNGASSSTSIPSGVQGVAPTGWHVPSKQEFIKLNNYLQTRPDCWVGVPQNTAKSMASQYGWEESTTEYAVGNDQSLNNNSSLNLIPAGSYRNNTVYYSGYAIISNATLAGGSSVYINPFILGAGYAYPILTALYGKEEFYLSVRCVYDGTPEQFIRMLMDKQVLVYDSSKQAWVNKNVAEALPSMSGNSGKVLAVNNDETSVKWVRPVTVYSGSSEPSASLGEDGDIFILAS